MATYLNLNISFAPEPSSYLYLHDTVAEPEIILKGALRCILFFLSKKLFRFYFFYFYVK